MVCATAEWQYIEYRCLYKRFKNEGRYIKLAYQELIEMYRFFLRLANRLMVSIAIALNHLSPKKPGLWNYKRIYLVLKSVTVIRILH